MMKAVSNKDLVKATKEGRLYLTTRDFFSQEKVQRLLVKLQDSSVYKKIETEKKEELKKAV